MPQLGEKVTEATITRWLKSVEDTVVEGEPLLEDATDKVDTEIPSPAGGILLVVSVPEQATADVGRHARGRVDVRPPNPSTCSCASEVDEIDSSFLREHANQRRRIHTLPLAGRHHG